MIVPAEGAAPPPAAMKNASYRPDIDGLRAVAILLVLAFHLFPKFFPGGFVGVDVFFVISGYLITGNILRHLEAGNFSYIGFYARRFRRILPALLLVLLAALIAGRCVLLADEFKSLGKHAFAGAAFVPNLLLWKETNYFDTLADLKPLLHLWSLGVEEQFYLIWPILLVFCYRRKLDISLLLGALGLASFSYNVRYVGARHEEIFYLLPGRFWELLIGCGLAHMEINDPHPIDRLLRRLSLNPPDFARFRLSPDVKAVAALVFLAAAALRIHATPEFKFPGLWALLPTTSAFLLISAGPASRINRRLLSDKTAVLIGLISYPLYLWHYPIISFARLTNIFELSPGIRLGIAAASFLLAWLTWRFAERPLQARLFAELPPRRRDERSVLSGLFALAAIGALGLLSAGGAFDSKSQVRSQAFNEWHARSEKQYIEEARYGRCTDATKEFAHFSPECYSPSSGISVWLWGDSHAAALYSSLRAYLDPAVSLLQTNNSGCAPVLSPYTPNLSQKCRDGNDFVFRRIESVKPDVMILAASWHVYAARDKNFFDTLDATIREIKKRGARRVVVIGPAPRWTADLYKIAERKYLFYGKPFPRRGTLGLDKDTVALDARMGNHFAGTNTAYIPLASRLCNDEGCMTMVGENLPDDLIAFDDSHLNRKGATYVVENFIGPALSKTLKTPAPPRN